MDRPEHRKLFPNPERRSGSSRIRWTDLAWLVVFWGAPILAAWRLA